MNNEMFGSLIFLALALAGCASSAANESIEKNYAQVGANAEAKEDWGDARQAFEQATHSADAAKSPIGRRAVLHYEYGRALGATCFFEQAENELLHAYDLDKQAGQPLFRSLIELARLNLDQHKFVIAVSYFERAFLTVDDAKTAKTAPAAYADTLDEYAHALSGAGRPADSTAAAKRATALRGANKIDYLMADRTPYGQYCGQR